VTLQRVGRTIEASWPPIEDAFGYHVVVTDATDTVVDTIDVAAADYTPPVRLSSAAITPGATYTVVVSVTGMPSQPGTVILPDPTEILAALRDRLIAARTNSGGGAWNYPLDDTVLPGSGDGDPGAVRVALVTALTPDATSPLVLTSPAGPVLAEQAGTLTLTGTSAALTADTTTTATLVFTASADLELEATWAATPPAGWTLASAFHALAETRFDYLPVSAATFVATTFAHADPAYFFPLRAGLHYQATLAVRGDLMPATGDSGESGALYTRVGGPVEITADGRPRFAWTAESALGALTVPRVGQDALILNGGMVALSCVPAVGAAPPSDTPRPSTGIDGTGDDTTAVPTTEDTLTITGQVTLAGTQTSCVLDLPTALADDLTLSAAGLSLTVASTTVALADFGTGDVLTGLLPATLLSLAGVTVTGYTVGFSATGDSPTVTTITLGFGTDVWALVPSLNLTVSSLGFSATVVRARGYGAEPLISWGAGLTGNLTLGGALYAVSARVPPSGAWYVEIIDTSQVPTLANLAGLANLTADQVSGVLPASLLDLGRTFTLSRVALLADPATQELAEVAFTIGQTSPWPLLGGALTLSGWTAEMIVAKDGDGTWTTTGVLRGNADLAAAGQTTTLNLELPVPVADDALWTLSLDPATPVQLPSIGQILALLGGDPAALPTGVATFGDLALTDFTVSVDPAAATLEHIGFSCRQAGDWVIIPPNGLVVTGVSAGLGFLPTTNPVGVVGQITGILTLAGSPVDVLVSKNDFTGPWRLSAGYEDFVHLPGFAELDAWLAPTESAGALPSTLPLSRGINVGEIFLIFAGDNTGALTSFGFTVSVDDVWTVVPGYLSLTDLIARLRLPYPVTAAGVTGTVAGVITLAGVDVAVAAAKPSTDSPWEFTGSLLAGLSLNLVDAANSVTASVLALPGDAVRRGLPTAIMITIASVRSVPDTGEFHFEGQAEFDWEFALGSAQLAICSIGGTIDIPQTGDPVAATVAGTFDFAGIHVVLTMMIGGVDASTVLTGVLTPTDAVGIQISGVTDGIGTSGDAQKWAAVAPTGLAALTFTDAALYVNLSTSVFLLYGGISVGTGLAANGMVYLSAPSSAPEAQWTYAVALALGPAFRFGAVLPALAVVDDHVRVASAHLVVCDLAGETLGELSQATTTLLGRIAPSVQAPLAGLDSHTRALSTGAYFAAQIDFEPVTLFSHLLRIGSDASPPSVWLEAVIDAADPAGTTFTADLPDITIADTILLTHTDAYPGIHLAYTPAQAARFELAGRVALTGIFNSSYAFDATLTVNDTGLTSTIAQTSQEITNPFGIPGIRLSGLMLTMSYLWATPTTPQTSSFTLGGHVLLGPAPAQGQMDHRLSCAATVALLSGTPVLFDVALVADFSIGAFLSQCLTGSGADWPTGFIDLAFLPGTHVYFYDSGADTAHTLATSNGFTFRDGFNVDALIRLTLVTDITVHGVLTVLRDPTTHNYIGIRAGITLDSPLDMVFAQLAGSTPPAVGQTYTGGPLLAFETGNTSKFLLNSGINFLQSAFLAAEVSVAKGTDGGTVMTGHLTAARPLAPFGVLSCGFSYTTHPSRDGEFAIEGWPDFTWVRDLVDLVSAIKALANTRDGTLCGNLADFVVNAAYSSSFSVRPSVSVDGTDLVFGFAGTYALTATGADAPFVGLEIPTFSVRIPSSTRWETLPDALATGVGGASTKFAQDLLNHPDKIAMFLAMVVGPKAGAVALELACNGLVDGAVAAAAEVAADAIAAAGGVLAAGAISAALTAITVSLAGSGNDGNGNDPTTIRTPHLRTVGYADGSVTGIWDAARGAAAYSFELLRPDGSVLVSHTFGLTLTGSLFVDPGPLLPGTYQAQVQATRGQQTSGWAALPLVKPAGPTVTLSYSEPSLVATWPDVHADGYVVQLFDTGGRQLGADVTLGGTVLQTAVALPDPVAGSYTAHVRAARTGQFPGDFGTTASLNVLSLAAPPTPAITRDGGVLAVAWTATTGLRYEVRLTEGSTVLATAEATSGTATFTLGSSPASGTSCTVSLRAHGSGALSPWTTTTFTFWDVPAPASATLNDQAGTLVATWAAVEVTGAPASTYRLSLIDAAQPDQPVGTQDGVTGTTATPNRTDGQQPIPSAHYTVTVRADVGGNLGAWATSPALVITQLPPPGAVTLTVAGQVFTVTWTAPDVPALILGPLGYDASLLCGTPVVASTTGLTATTWSPSRTDGHPPSPGESYTVNVRADVPGHESAWAASAQIMIMDTPQLTSVAYTTNTITATWSRSTFSFAAYDVEAVPAAGGDTVMVSVTGPPDNTPTTVQLSVTGKPRGTYNVRVRATSPGSAGEWGAPQAVTVLDGVGGVTVASDGTQLTVSWTAEQGATGYTVQVHAPDGTLVHSTDVAPAVPGGVPPNTASVTVAGMTPGTAYTATVQAQMGAATSAPSVPVSFTLPAAPTGVTVAYDGSQLTATWNPVNGAGSYLLDLHLPDGSVARSVTVPQPSLGAPDHTVQTTATGFQRGVTYILVVRTREGTLDSAPSMPIPLTLIDAPTGITTTAVTTSTGSTIDVSWAASAGALQYQVRLENAQGATVLTQTATTTSASCTGPQITPGGIYAVQVSGLADVAGPWSTALQVTVPVVFTCLCLGVTPGLGCGNVGVGDNFTGVYLNATQKSLDTEFFPTRGPSRSGWVAVPPGRAGQVAVLAQLVAALSANGVLTGTEPFDVFAKSVPSAVRNTEAAGNFTCLCLGTAPGGDCGNNGIGDNFSGVFVNVTQADLDANFHPTRAPSRSGWVSVGNAPYIPLEVLLQLVTLLAKNGKLTGTAPYDVFNQTVSVHISAGSGGSTTCVALGAPIGKATQPKKGNFGDVVSDVAPIDLPGYQVGPKSGWASIGQADYSVLSAILQLVTLLSQKGVLTGTQPYDVFNNATAYQVRSP
jgi:hypothetical protein